MRVLQVTSEVALIAKVGGLGDVITGLSRELLQQNIDILILLPRYGCVDFSLLTPIDRKESFQTSFAGSTYSAHVEFFLLQNTIPVALLDTDDGMWAKRETIYGQEDEAASFIYFGRACSDWLQSTIHRFDIVHVHDWETSLLAVLLKYLWNAPHKVPKTVLTLHNLEYQGRCGYNQLTDGCADILNRSPAGLFDDPCGGCANLLKGGILSSDLLNTVSKTYAQEILTSEGGKGLDVVLQKRSKDLFGIVNGLDTVYWNPAEDSFLTKTYSEKDTIEQISEAKLVAKKALFEEVGIDVRFLHLPLIASVTRLVHHKGLSMLHHVFSHLGSLDAAGIVLGAAFDTETTRQFSELNDKLTQEKRGCVILKSQESLAHRIFAASEILIAPSLCEPCGLTQLLALRYGTIPVVRRTGGFADTISDHQFDLPVGSGNGFVFEKPEDGDALEAVGRALSVYRTAPTIWQHLILAGMQADYSWSKPAAAYINLYHLLTTF